MSVQPVDFFRTAIEKGHAHWGKEDKKFETLIKDKSFTSSENLYQAATEIFDAASKNLLSANPYTRKIAMDQLLKAYIILKESTAPNSPIHQQKNAVRNFFSWSLRQHNSRIATAEKMFEVHFSSYVEARHNLHIHSNLESEINHHTDNIEMTLHEMGIGLTKWKALKSALVHGNKDEANRLWNSILAEVRNTANNPKLLPNPNEAKNFLLGTKELAAHTSNTKFKELEGKINLEAPAVQREWIKLRIAFLTKGKEEFAKQADKFLSFKKNYETIHPQKTVSKPKDIEDFTPTSGGASQENIKQAIQEIKKTEDYKKFLVHAKNNPINATKLARDSGMKGSLNLKSADIEKIIEDTFAIKLEKYTNKELKDFDNSSKTKSLTKEIANEIYDEFLTTQLKNIKERKGTPKSKELIKEYFNKNLDDIDHLSLEQLLTVRDTGVLVPVNAMISQSDTYKKIFNHIREFPIDALQIARTYKDNRNYSQLTHDDLERILRDAFSKESEPRFHELYSITKTKESLENFLSTLEINKLPLSKDLEKIKGENKNNPAMNRIFTYFGKHPQDIGFLNKAQQEDLLMVAESAIKEPAMSDRRKLELEAIIRVLNPNSNAIPKHSIDNMNATRKLANSEDVINEFKNLQEYKNFVYFLETNPEEAKKLGTNTNQVDQFLLKNLEKHIKSIHENSASFLEMKQHEKNEYDKRDLVPHYLYNNFKPTPENIKHLFDNLVDNRFTKTKAPEKIPHAAPTEEKAKAAPKEPKVHYELQDTQIISLEELKASREEAAPPLEDLDGETKLLSDLFDSTPEELRQLEKKYWNNFPLKLWESNLSELSNEQLKAIPQGLLSLSLLIPFKNQLLQRFKKGDKDLQNKMEGTYMILFASFKRLKSPVLSLLSTLNTHLETIQNDLNSKNISQQHGLLNEFLKGIDENIQINEPIIKSFNALLERTTAIYRDKKTSEENKEHLNAFSKTIEAFIKRIPALQEAKEASKLNALNQYPFNAPRITKQRNM